MQSQPNSSNTPSNVATRFVNSENLSRLWAAHQREVEA
jgi:hypothetical protein